VPDLPTLAGLAYREAVPAGTVRGEALLVHGFPESSHMWRAVLETLAAAGIRAVAPDLAGFGDSPPRRPGTWESQIDALERFRRAAGIERAALVVHDWGGLIGLRWACDRPEAVSALVISDTGFFPDGKWHGLAQGLRTEGQGEQIVEALTPEGFAEVMRQASPGMDEAAHAECYKCLADDERRASVLELYRSGDFAKLEPYEGRLAALGVPTLVLWGERDDFAPLAGGQRLAQEIPGAELTVIEGSGHFVFDDEAQLAAERVAEFLSAHA
jgi:haloalkane dehalogenase